MTRDDIAAGEAYVALHGPTTRERLKDAFVSALGPEEYARLETQVASDPEIVRMDAELRELILAGKKDLQSHYRKYHLDAPETLEDWLELAEIVGVPTDEKSQEGLTARLIERKAIAYVKRLRLHNAVTSEQPAKQGQKHNRSNQGKTALGGGRGGRPRQIDDETFRQWLDYRKDFESAKAVAGFDMDLWLRARGIKKKEHTRRLNNTTPDKQARRKPAE